MAAILGLCCHNYVVGSATYQNTVSEVIASLSLKTDGNYSGYIISLTVWLLLVNKQIFSFPLH